jgi:hypothetical protein
MERGLAATLPGGYRPAVGRNRSLSWPEGEERKELKFVKEALDLMGVMRGALRRERRLKERYRDHLRSLYGVWEGNREVDSSRPYRDTVHFSDIALEGATRLSPKSLVIPAKGPYQVSSCM